MSDSWSDDEDMARAIDASLKSAEERLEEESVRVEILHQERQQVLAWPLLVGACLVDSNPHG
jgi:hypothetical protein